MRNMGDGMWNSIDRFLEKHGNLVLVLGVLVDDHRDFDRWKSGQLRRFPGKVIPSVLCARSTPKPPRLDWYWGVGLLELGRLFSRNRLRSNF